MASHVSPRAGSHVDNVNKRLALEHACSISLHAFHILEVLSQVSVISHDHLLDWGRGELLNGLPDFSNGLLVNIDAESSSELHEVGGEHGHEHLHKHGVGLFSFLTGCHHLDNGSDESIPHLDVLSDGDTLKHEGEGVLALTKASNDLSRGCSHLELEFSRLVGRDLVDELLYEVGDNSRRARATSSESVSTISKSAGEGYRSHSLELVEESYEATFTELGVVDALSELESELRVGVSGVGFFLAGVKLVHECLTSLSGLGSN